MSQQCNFCGNRNLSAKHTRYIHQQDGAMLIVEDVPCIECDYCGEQYFEIKTLKMIEADHLALAGHRKQPSRTLRVAVEDFHAL